MGQCSTLPADKKGNKSTSNTSSETGNGTTNTSGKRMGYKQQREERESYNGRGSVAEDRHYDGDVVMGDGNMSPEYSHPQSRPSGMASRRQRDTSQMMTVVKEGHQQFEPFLNDPDQSQGSHPYHSNSSSKSSRHGAARPAPVCDTREEYIPIPPPPEGSVKTKCYRLNLDVPVVLSPTHDTLGPFHYSAPPHLLPTSGESIDQSMSSDSVEKSTVQIAIDTALIFRGIKVDNNGTIMSRNDRASRSRRSTNNTSKTAENSRQSAKINKANDLVDEMVANGKENNGEKPNMISIYPVGEYDDMKQLVRDGARKLRESEGKPEETIYSWNRHRASTRNGSRRSGADYPVSPNSSSRRRLSSSYHEHPSTPMSVSSSRSKSKNRVQTIAQSAPPKIKGHPRDRASSRRMGGSDERNPRYGEKCNNMSLFGGGDSDWSDALNFNSIWNCGGTGTMSPSNNANHVDAKNGNARMQSNKVRYEGRNESSTRFSRGVSERDAPLVL